MYVWAWMLGRGGKNRAAGREGLIDFQTPKDSGPWQVHDTWSPLPPGARVHPSQDTVKKQKQALRFDSSFHLNNKEIVTENECFLVVRSLATA